jgi:hypothetical protein
MLQVVKFPLQEAFERDPLGSTINYYASCLEKHPKAVAAVERLLGLSVEAARDASIGFSDRSLGNQLPAKQVVAGLRLRTRLEELGIYKANGRESLRGFITIPFKDADGKWTGIRAIPIDARTGEGSRLLVGCDAAKDVSVGDTKLEVAEAEVVPAEAVKLDIAPTNSVEMAHSNPPNHEVVIAPEHVLITRGDRTYRIRGLDKNLSSISLQVSIQATRQDSGSPNESFGSHSSNRVGICR